GGDSVQNLEGVRRPAVADELVHVGGVDAGGVAHVDGQLGQLLIQLPHLGSDQVDQQPGPCLRQLFWHAVRRPTAHTIPAACGRRAVYRRWWRPRPVWPAGWWRATT